MLRDLGSTEVEVEAEVKVIIIDQWKPGNGYL